MAPNRYGNLLIMLVTGSLLPSLLHPGAGWQGQGQLCPVLPSTFTYQYACWETRPSLYPQRDRPAPTLGRVHLEVRIQMPKQDGHPWAPGVTTGRLRLGHGWSPAVKRPALVTAEIPFQKRDITEQPIPGAPGRAGFKIGRRGLHRLRVGSNSHHPRKPATLMGGDFLRRPQTYIPGTCRGSSRGLAE